MTRNVLDAICTDLEQPGARIQDVVRVIYLADVCDADRAGVDSH